MVCAVGSIQHMVKEDPFRAEYECPECSTKRQPHWQQQIADCQMALGESIRIAQLVDATSEDRRRVGVMQTELTALQKKMEHELAKVAKYHAKVDKRVEEERKRIMDLQQWDEATFDRGPPYPVAPAESSLRTTLEPGWEDRVRQEQMLRALREVKREQQEKEARENRDKR